MPPATTARPIAQIHQAPGWRARGAVRSSAMSGIPSRSPLEGERATPDQDRQPDPGHRADRSLARLSTPAVQARPARSARPFPTRRTRTLRRRHRPISRRWARSRGRHLRYLGARCRRRHRRRRRGASTGVGAMVGRAVGATVGRGVAAAARGGGATLGGDAVALVVNAQPSTAALGGPRAGRPRGAVRPSSAARGCPVRPVRVGRRSRRARLRAGARPAVDAAHEPGHRRDLGDRRSPASARAVDTRSSGQPGTQRTTTPASSAVKSTTTVTPLEVGHAPLDHAAAGAGACAEDQADGQDGRERRRPPASIAGPRRSGSCPPPSPSRHRQRRRDCGHEHDHRPRRLGPAAHRGVGQLAGIVRGSR